MAFLATEPELLLPRMNHDAKELAAMAATEEKESVNAISTTRLETFSDGVLAIAATLLILEVQRPGDEESIGHWLLHGWVQLAAYVSGGSRSGRALHRDRGRGRHLVRGDLGLPAPAPPSAEVAHARPQRQGHPPRARRPSCYLALTLLALILPAVAFGLAAVVAVSYIIPPRYLRVRRS
jgi:hypothetical protein